MKFILFIFGFLGVFLGSHIYISARAAYYLQLSATNTKWTYIILLALACISIIGFIIEQKYSSAVTQWAYLIGNIWLAALLYLFLGVIIIDIISLLFSLVSNFSILLATRWYIAYSLLAAIGITLIAGNINARNPKVTHLALHIQKPLHNTQKLRIVAASDLHFGAILGTKHEKKFVDMVTQLQPDIVLLCGDLLDGNIAPVKRKGIGTHLQTLRPPLGIYSISGNHEYIGSIKDSKDFYASINIPIIEDSIVSLPNGLQIIGRKDAHSKMQRPLEELIAMADKSLPIIVLNHQPHQLQETAMLGTDLHISGHTHHGQLWPLQYITKALFELSWGYKKSNNSHLYVSSGFGTWGPPIRIGNTPEIVCFDIDFLHKN